MLVIEGGEIKVKTRYLVEFSIGKYQDAIWYDVALMDVCHLLLGRPWQYDHRIIYDGFKNTYAFNKNGCKIILAPFKPILPLVPEKEKIAMLMSRAELERELRKGYDVFALVVVEENENVQKILKVVKSILKNFQNVVVDALSRKHALLTSLYVKIIRFDVVKELYCDDANFGEIWKVCV